MLIGVQVSFPSLLLKGAFFFEGSSSLVETDCGRSWR